MVILWWFNSDLMGFTRPGKLTVCHGKIHHFRAGKIHYFDWAMFNSYVKLPEAMISESLVDFSWDTYDID